FENKIYAAGFDGKFYHYPDKDNTWHFSQNAYWEWFHNIDFATNNKGFIVYGLAFHKGGIIQVDSLGDVLQIDSFGLEFSDIHFISSNTGYASGYGAIMKTTNGGSTWDFLNIQGDFFKSLSCPDSKNIWSVGYNG